MLIKFRGGHFFSLSAYTQNERIDKTALFALYINSDFIEGEVNMYGKIMGLDKTMSKAQVQELQNFINDNKLLRLFGVGAGAFGFESVMRASDLSIDEFKEKWLEYKVKVEKEFELTNEKQSTEQNSGVNLQNLDVNLAQNENEQNSAQKRSPIQVTSKSQTYTDSYFAKYKDFLNDAQKEQMFEILFGKNGANVGLNGAGKSGVLSGANLSSVFGGVNLNSTDFNTNLMNLNLSQIKPLSQIDITI